MQDSNTKEKRYPVPEEILDIIITAFSYKDLRAIYAKTPFGYKKAMKLSVLYSRKLQKFWSLMYKLYPEIRKHKVDYNMGDTFVTVEGDSDQ